MVGGSCGCAFSPLSSLWLEFGRVDVPIQPASEYSWTVTRVDVPIQLGEFVVLFSFCFLPMASQGCSFVFFCYIIRNALVECRSFKKKINQVLDLLKNQILQRLQGTKELIWGAAGALNDAGDIVLLSDERRPSLASTRHSSQTSHAAGRVKGREG